MLVGNNKSTTMKNADKLLAISIVWPRLPFPAGILWIPFDFIFFRSCRTFCTGIMIPVPPEPWQEGHQESGLCGAYVGCYVGNEFVKKNTYSLLRLPVNSLTTMGAYYMRPTF